ncbi:hypothetical protein J5TS2_34940 [Brevibacillus halotolerans]|nr:hypothetical protein J5TS2_34940 [Brevibacillus halotolerans]
MIVATKKSVITTNGNEVSVIPAIAIPLPLEEFLARIPKIKPEALIIKAKKMVSIVPGDGV